MNIIGRIMLIRSKYLKLSDIFGELDVVCISSYIANLDPLGLECNGVRTYCQFGSSNL